MANVPHLLELLDSRGVGHLGAAGDVAECVQIEVVDSRVVDDEALDEDLLDHVEDIEGKLGSAPLYCGGRAVWFHVDLDCYSSKVM